MHWFFIALISPFLWALVNHIDKYLLSKYLKVEGPGALIIFSSMAGLLVLPVAIFFCPNVFQISLKNTAILLAAGVISAFAIYFYFLALFNDETTNVVPLFQIIPVFGFFLGYFLLNEIISRSQIMGSFIVVIGSILLTVERKKGSFLLFFRNKSSSLMLLSSFLYAVYEVLFKFVAIDNNFWLSIFWQNVGLILVGCIFLLFIKKFRMDFTNLYFENGKKILIVNIANELLTIIGNVIFSYAILLAPIALVMTVGGYQPAFALFVGIIITTFFPSIGREDISKEKLIRKFLSIALITLGSFIAFT